MYHEKVSTLVLNVKVVICTGLNIFSITGLKVNLRWVSCFSDCIFPSLKSQVLKQFTTTFLDGVYLWESVSSHFMEAVNTKCSSGVQRSSWLRYCTICWLDSWSISSCCMTWMKGTVTKGTLWIILGGETSDWIKSCYYLQVIWVTAKWQPLQTLTIHPCRIIVGLPNNTHNIMSCNNWQPSC